MLQSLGFFKPSNYKRDTWRTGLVWHASPNGIPSSASISWLNPLNLLKKWNYCKYSKKGEKQKCPITLIFSRTRKGWLIFLKKKLCTQHILALRELADYKLQLSMNRSSFVYGQRSMRYVTNNSKLEQIYFYCPTAWTIVQQESSNYMSHSELSNSGLSNSYY